MCQQLFPLETTLWDQRGSRTRPTRNAKDREGETKQVHGCKKKQCKKLFKKLVFILHCGVFQGICSDFKKITASYKCVA